MELLLALFTGGHIPQSMNTKEELLPCTPENTTRPGRVCNLAICLIALLLFIGESDANPDSRRRQFGKASHGQLAFTRVMYVAHGRSAL